MDVDVLLRRQMELHGTLRHAPHTPAELKNVYETIKELLAFFRLLRSTATTLKTSPESVFQCLMHIGAGEVVSFDKQRRDGALPMHQAKVLARANAIELEPRLKAAVAASKLENMVNLCKTTRTLLRVKVEDGNDFNTAELALQEATEYLDFIDSVSANDSEVMFKFYMVEDEASLLALLGRGAQQDKCEFSKDATATRTTLQLPAEAQLIEEVRCLANVSSLSTESAKNRLQALQTINFWMEIMDEEQYLRQIFDLISCLLDPLSVCLKEKRSTLCRQACIIILTITQRTPAKFYLEGSLNQALCRWSAPLLRGIFSTVSVIAQVTDEALRALIFSSSGNSTLVKNIVSALELGTHPQLRRRCLGYLALSVVLTQGGVCTTSLQLDGVGTKYMEIGDAACRGMARALCVATMHFVGAPKTVINKKSECLLLQEKERLLGLVDDVAAFEAAIFDDSVKERFFSARNAQGASGGTHTTLENLRDSTLSAITDFYDTDARLFHCCESLRVETKLPRPGFANTFERDCNGELAFPRYHVKRDVLSSEPIKQVRPKPARPGFFS